MAALVSLCGRFSLWPFSFVSVLVVAVLDVTPIIPLERLKLLYSRQTLYAGSVCQVYVPWGEKLPHSRGEDHVAHFYDLE